MGYSPGLRAKFNAVVLPVLALTFGLVVAADYRHELRTVMAAHQFHATATGAADTATPIDPATTPEAAGRATLMMHGGFALLTLTVVLLAINVALSLFVLRPLDRIRAACSRLERGQWYPADLPLSGDEMGTVTHAFEDLGLRLDALVGQSLQAERLATLALLGRTVAARVEPEVARIGVSVGRLHGMGSAPVTEEAEAIATATATILASIRGLDHGFHAAFRRTKAGSGS